MTKHYHSTMLSSGIAVRAARPRGVEKLREAIDKAAAGLIELSEVIDGDPDLEPDTDDEETGDIEPDLGSTDQADQTGWAGGANAEDDVDQ